MISRFWSDSFWLPVNTTWEDVSNGPGKTVVYAEAKDFWSLVPLVSCLLILRFLIERYILSNLGRYLKISDLKVKAPTNAKLEAAYRISSTCKNISSLAKQLDLSEQEIKRWWRLRRQQDKPTTIVKFTESFWKGLNFLINVSFALYVVWGEEWTWDLDKCFEGYPHQGITPGLWWVYMLELSYYVSLIITQFRDVRRKDFWPLFFHHITVVWLLTFSWVCQAFRIGSLFLILGDIADVPLEFGKAAKYAKLMRIVDCLFAVFVFTWVVARLVITPLFILPSAFNNHHLSPIFYLMMHLIYFLFGLTLYWTWLIFKVVRRVLFAGEFPNDCRSSDSEMDDNSNSSPNNTLKEYKGTYASTKSEKKNGY